MTARLRYVAAIFLLASLANLAFAQYPTRPLRLVVPYPAEGTADGVGREATQSRAMDRTSDDRRRSARGRHAPARGAGALAGDRGGLLQTGADRWRGPRQHARGDAPSRLDRVAAVVPS